MLSLASQVKIYVHLPPTDMRKSFDGLTGLVRSAFQADPRDGSWFRFFNHPKAPPGKTGASSNHPRLPPHPHSLQPTGRFWGAPEWPVLRCPLTLEG